jgi:hypothetical protein
LKVGSVVQVKSFSEYVVKVPLEEGDGYVSASKVPAGTYVTIRSGQGHIVGIVTGVRHDVKEEYLPFLSEEKQEIFTPYSNDFRSSYLLIQGIGNVRDGKALQSLDFAPIVNDTVELMSNDGIRAFHMPNGRPSFSYYRKLSSVLEADTLCCAIDHVAMAVPECKPLLGALKKHTENKA